MVKGNHKAGPNMGDGNSGSSVDSDGPQNILGVQEVSSDPKTREEVSRVSVCPRTQTISPAPIHDEQAEARPVYLAPGVLRATREASDLVKQQQRLRATEPLSHKPEPWFPPQLSRPQTSKQPNIHHNSSDAAGSFQAELLVPYVCPELCTRDVTTQEQAGGFFFLP